MRGVLVQWRTRTPGLSASQATASLTALTGRARTALLAGLAANICFSFVNGLMPSRAGRAGFFTTTNFAKPCRTKMPVLLELLVPDVTRVSTTCFTCLRETSSPTLSATAVEDLGLRQGLRLLVRARLRHVPCLLAQEKNAVCRQVNRLRSEFPCVAARQEAFFVRRPSRRRLHGVAAARPAMPLVNPFLSLTGPQFHAFFASLAGWALDAFDFFLLVFAVRAIARDFHTDVRAVSQCIFWTLAMRPVGALVFGWLAERYGRRPVLMINVISYSVCELASAAAPNLATLLGDARALRAGHGRRMGRRRSAGARDAPAKNRGFFSGLLQEGTSSATSWRRSSSRCSSTASAGAGCSCSARRPRCSCSTCGASVEESPAWLAGGRRGQEQRDLGEDVGRAAKHCRTLLLPGRADGVLQRAEPRLAGPVPHVPAGAARLRRVAHDGARGHRLQRRRVLAAACSSAPSPERIGRRRRIAVAAILALPRHPALGVLVDGGHVRGGRVRDAVHDPGRMGRGAGAPERAVAAVGAGHPARASPTSSATSRCRSSCRCRRGSPRLGKRLRAGAVVDRRGCGGGPGDRGARRARGEGRDAGLTRRTPALTSPGRARSDKTTVTIPPAGAGNDRLSNARTTQSTTPGSGSELPASALVATAPLRSTRNFTVTLPSRAGFSRSPFS